MIDFAPSESRQLSRHPAEPTRAKGVPDRYLVGRIRSFAVASVDGWPSG